MGIVRTDRWLKEEFDRPMNICAKLLPYFNKLNTTEIYNQLQKYGMYKPSWAARSILEWMMEQNAWTHAGHLLKKYREKWSGPDIPVFLFPLSQSRGFFLRQENTKSGVSYPDKMFLFISEIEDIKEMEALFVHEYHHVCRLQKLNKKMEDYTLLDSIMIEGLAEYAVLNNCGRNYLAKWCRMYSEDELLVFWDRFLVEHLEKRKRERTHDHLLYGGGRYPNLLGYALGFAIAENYYKNNNYSERLSFSIPASEYLKKNNKFSKKST